MGLLPPNSTNYQYPRTSNSIILFDGYESGSDNRGNASFFGTNNRSTCIYQNYDSSDSMVIAIVAYRLGNDNAEIGLR